MSDSEARPCPCCNSSLSIPEWQRAREALLRPRFTKTQVSDALIETKIALKRHNATRELDVSDVIATLQQLGVIK